MINTNVNTYNLRNFQEFVMNKKITILYGLETISYQYPQVWSLFPETLKETNSLSQFKRNMRQWVSSDFPCRFCKPYVQNLGMLIMQKHICVGL